MMHTPQSFIVSLLAKWVFPETISRSTVEMFAISAVSQMHRETLSQIDNTKQTLLTKLADANRNTNKTIIDHCESQIAAIDEFKQKILSRVFITY